MSSKINIAVIVRDHVRTLHRYGSEKVNWFDLVTFYAVPVIFAPAPLLLEPCKITDFCSVIIGAFSVLTALLLNLQALIITRVDADFPLSENGIERRLDKDRLRIRHELLQEISKNISYSILVAIVVVVLFIAAYLLSSVSVAILGFYVVVHFVLTALMILKRFHVLITGDFSNRSVPGK